jgi:class 3 adenylate cyclase
VKEGRASGTVTVLFTDLVGSTALMSRLGEVASAQALHDLLSRYAEQLLVTASVICGAATYHLGVLGATLGRFDEAEARFTAAEATHERIGAPNWLARTRLEWARMLLTRRQPGDPGRTRHLLGEALDTARELGLGNVERRAVALLQ